MTRVTSNHNRPAASTSQGSPSISVGCRVMVSKLESSLTVPHSTHPINYNLVYYPAEIMSIRTLDNNTTEYYVHFDEMNKRLDEWVTTERMDLNTIKAASKKPPPSLAQKTPAKGPARGRKKSSLVMKIVEEEQSETTSKLEEIEHLRHGGSMTRRLDEIARVKNIDWVEFGRHRLECWYFSPYPPELINAHGNTTIHLCEFCLQWHSTRDELRRHAEKCVLRCPPGTEIARQDNLSFFELDGHRQKDWTRRLCLLAKLFLDHKTLFYDVDPFMYYVLCENDEFGSHLIGYFSKEKDSADNYNVACILTLPSYQRKGYGRLLIEFSYELTKKEGKTGSPEKPLSDLGLLSYRSYWAEVLMQHLLQAANDGEEISIDALSRLTAFTPEDILHTLQTLDAIRYRRGQHVIVLPEKAIKDWERAQAKIKLRFDPKCLQWTPPVFSAAQLRFL